MVIDNQLSRRNLDPMEASILRGKKYLLEKKEIGRPENVAKTATLTERTREKIAQETGVSPRTISNDAQLAQAVENLKEIPKEILKQNPPLGSYGFIASSKASVGIMSSVTIPDASSMCSVIGNLSIAVVNHTLPA